MFATIETMTKFLSYSASVLLCCATALLLASTSETTPTHHRRGWPSSHHHHHHHGSRRHGYPSGSFYRKKWSPVKFNKFHGGFPRYDGDFSGFPELPSIITSSFPDFPAFPSFSSSLGHGFKTGFSTPSSFYYHVMGFGDDNSKR
jgi:hypothetical protein